MLNRFIVPLDGSQLSHAALPLARGLAEQTGAAVTLLSVIDPPRDFYAAPQGASSTRLRPKDIDHLAEEDKRLQHYLEGLKTTFKDISVSTEVRLGNAAEEILDAAESTAGTAIIMASHGRSGLGRMLLGSVANRIVQATHVPVYITRAKDESRAEFGKQKINHVAIPLDGSQLAEQALEQAYDTFRNNVRYTVMRVVEPIPPGQAYAAEAILNYEREARDAADTYLAEVTERLSGRGATVSADVRVTQPANGITQIAGEFGAELIAMTTHGRSGMERFLMGSIAERVVRTSELPVMLLRGVPDSE